MEIFKVYLCQTNPYFGQDFFGVVFTLLKRLFLFVSGQSLELAADELQLLILSGIAISSALVGTWLVLRRLAMLANSLSHTTLLGIVLVFIFERWRLGGEINTNLSIWSLIVASLISGFLTAFMTEFLTHRIRLQEDASNGVVFSFLFALGIVLVTVLTRNAHVGTELVMGNVDMLHIDDLKTTLWVSLLNVVLILVFYRGYLVTTFDRSFAASSGFGLAFFQYLLLFQVSLTSVSAFRAVGVLMVLAFIVGLPLIARLWTNRLPIMLLIAVFAGILASALGVALSRHVYSIFHLPLSTGGVVVCMILLLYVLSLSFNPRGALWRLCLKQEKRVYD